MSEHRFSYHRAASAAGRRWAASSAAGRSHGILTLPLDLAELELTLVCVAVGEAALSCRRNRDSSLHAGHAESAVPTCRTVWDARDPIAGGARS